MSFYDLPYDILKYIQCRYLELKDLNITKNLCRKNKKAFNEAVEDGIIPIAGSFAEDFNKISDVNWFSIELGDKKIKSDKIKTLFVNLDLLNLQYNWKNAIPDKFLNGCKFRRIIIRGKTITKILFYFLYECSSLTSLDLRGLNNVTGIAYGFLYNCKSLTSLDLSGLNNVTTIGGGFLYNCSSLTSLDLNGLNNVTIIGEGFLYACSSLSSLDLSALNNVTTIDCCFLICCKSLTSLDLSGLNNVTTIRELFLSGCSSLTSLDLSNVTNPAILDNYTIKNFIK
jgi:surface protein